MSRDSSPDRQNCRYRRQGLEGCHVRVWKIIKILIIGDVRLNPVLIGAKQADWLPLCILYIRLTRYC